MTVLEIWQSRQSGSHNQNIKISLIFIDITRTWKSFNYRHVTGSPDLYNENQTQGMTLEQSRFAEHVAYALGGVLSRQGSKSMIFFGFWNNIHCKWLEQLEIMRNGLEKRWILWCRKVHNFDQGIYHLSYIDKVSLFQELHFMKGLHFFQTFPLTSPNCRLTFPFMFAE